MSDDPKHESIDLAEVPRWRIVHEKGGRYYNSSGQELPGDLARIEDTYRRRYGVKPVIRKSRKPRVIR